MKKVLFTTFLLFTISICKAQTLDKLTMSIAGEVQSNAELLINFTIGEPLIGMVFKESSVDQGFWAGSLQVIPITEVEYLNGIIIYPNPVTDELNIYADNNAIYGITLFAVDGKMALKKKIDETLLTHTIDTSHLAKGMYVLRLFIEGSDQEKLFKVIKK